MSRWDTENVIKDSIINKTYDGWKCRWCNSVNVFLLHTENEEYPDDVSKDFVFCRCEDCRHLVNNPLDRRGFHSVEEAVDAWNKAND